MPRRCARLVSGAQSGYRLISGNVWLYVCCSVVELFICVAAAWLSLEAAKSVEFLRPLEMPLN